MIQQGDLVTVLRRYAEILLDFLVMMVVGMMIVPVPPFLLDLLLVLNISISMIMLLIAMYIPEALKLAVGALRRAEDAPALQPFRPIRYGSAGDRDENDTEVNLETIGARAPRSE